MAKPSSSHEPGIRKSAIFSAGSKPASMQPLITPRATMSTRVFETTFIITAIFFDVRPRADQLRERRLLDRRVAADLAVVRRPPAGRAHRVEERQRAAPGADDEPEVAVELGEVAGDAARVGASTCAAAISNCVGGRAWRLSSGSRPVASAGRVLPRCASASMSMCASSAMIARHRACRSG
jgi:hypothetical protein